jgi:hypothetical protein
MRDSGPVRRVVINCPVIADIQRAEAKSQEMQQLADRTEVLAEQSDHRLRELKTKRLNNLANPATHGDWRVTLE